MSEEEKSDVNDAEEVETGQGASNEAPAPRRSNRQAAAAQKAVVPMWLWVVTVLLLMGGAGAVWFVKTMNLKSFKEQHLERMGAKNEEIKKLEGTVALKNEEIKDQVQARLNIKKAYDKLDAAKADKVMELQKITREHEALKTESSEKIASLQKELASVKGSLRDKEGKLSSLEKDINNLKAKEKELAETKDKLEGSQSRFKEIHTELVNTRIQRDDLEKMVKYYKQEKIPQMKAYIEELEGGKKD